MTELYMYQMKFEQGRMFELARRNRLPLRDVDMGYLVHCQMKELFDDLAPRPFSIVGEQGRFVSILGYGTSSLEELKERASLFAEPAVYDGCDWSSVAVKRMPQNWKTGQRFGFQIRCCPVVRKKDDPDDPNSKRKEYDAFLDYRAENPSATEFNREQVYRDWFRDLVALKTGATVEQVGMVRFKRERLLRRTHGEVRISHQFDRPDATMQGVLQVTDGELFFRLLRQGLGRHKAFGFGMLLLKPCA